MIGHHPIVPPAFDPGEFRPRLTDARRDVEERLVALLNTFKPLNVAPFLPAAASGGAR